MVVFVDEQKVPPWEEMDEFDETADHFAVIVNGSIVGTARIVDKGGKVGKIGRVAVLREHRGKGLGRELMESVLTSARGRFGELTLDAQLGVIPFYESLGFTAEGNTFIDAGIEHRRMRLALSTSPDQPD
jgi:predicted GNAT family N-acyltransferase